MACMAVSPWTAGGWVSSQKFTARWVLRFLERLTGVQEPSISQRCRKTFDDLTSVVCHDCISRPPVLLETGARLDLATYEAA
ncbi:hypothetical protein EV653_1092 [Kribbella pratensis]|uniref:Uncharacterized protein n=1 Tax=Kribbella pratensis TaxID=2512112 RepID=A0A4R8CJU2_9ACTN|nr:hypothetical protein EV653_1092 [Kribbella pratensis]